MSHPADCHQLSTLASSLWRSHPADCLNTLPSHSSYHQPTVHISHFYWEKIFMKICFQFILSTSSLPTNTQIYIDAICINKRKQPTFVDVLTKTVLPVAPIGAVAFLTSASHSGETSQPCAWNHSNMPYRMLSSFHPWWPWLFYKV